ncbi:MAG: AraC family transcriptional regulator [Phototrophicales bacterium]|nr:MAG: AraC family transcriptional regulator [Phototrophicales bacterium]
MKRRVAIMIFDDVEVLDFCGPFEVFAVTRDYRDGETELFDVYTVAEKDTPVIARNGLSVNPAYTLETCPKPDILLVPGGRGTRTEMNNPIIVNWVAKQAPQCELVLSVCTGAFILAKANLLKGLAATTYHTAFDLLQELEPSVTIKRGERFVDNGQVVTSAGISAGIDMALYIVARLHGLEQARWTAQHMEYHWAEIGVSE